ncbi:MAG: polymer-forming cytoskeletal protein [Spirochaetaceae bacterium]|jgi:cytoskeletal protein CcmA (bactofilin family)|nr:polymer-forming cytoskeletal protein [Spirochaetaceae bacterium]
MHELKEMDFLDFEDKDFDTILEDDIRFRGSMRFTKPMMIRGQVSGSIQCGSDLVLDTDSVAESDITADRVLIRGRVKGNVNSQRIVVVSSTGSLRGDIRSRHIVLEPGNDFSGYVDKT